MGEKLQYKIQISSSEVVGPVGFEEIKKLLKDGKITGNEPTYKLSEGLWKNFASYPELAELAMASIAQKTIKSIPIETLKKKVREEATKTLKATEPSFETPDKSERAKERKEEDIYIDVPTLPDINPSVDPDLEQTKVINELEPAPEDKVSEETSLISSEELLPLTIKKGEQKPIEKMIPGAKKKRILSKNIFYALCLGILIILLNPAREVKREQALETLAPKLYKFKKIQINALAQSKKKINNYKSKQLYLIGKKHYKQDTPIDLLKAMSALYKSTFYNPKILQVRALLASAYMRGSEVNPRNAELFNTVTKLIELTPRQAAAQKPVEYIIAKTEYYMMLQLFERAHSFLKNTVNVSTPHPELLYLDAKLAEVRGETNRAIHTIARAINLSPIGRINPRHMVFYAKILEKKGNVKVAKRVLKSVLEHKPNHGMARYYYAKLLIKEREINPAFGHLVTIVQNPSTVDRLYLAKTFVLVANLYEKKRMYKKAFQFAYAAKKILPQDRIAEDSFFKIYAKNFKNKRIGRYLLLGKEKEKRQKYEEALNFYTRAKELSNRSTIILEKLGDVYNKMGHPKNAIHFYKKAITTTGKKNPSAYIKLSKMHITRYELKDAKNMLRSARDILGKSPRIDYVRGLMFLQKNNKPRAKALFAAALQKGARIPQLYVEMGKLESKKNKSILSEFYYSMALRYNPIDEDALLGIALSRFHRTTPSEAINLLKLKLYIDPTSSAIMTNLALIYLNLGDRRVGKYYLKKALELDPKYAKSYKLIGDQAKEESDRQQYFEEKRRGYKFALASYEAYSRLRPNDPAGYMATADLFFTVRDLGSAAKNYNKVLRLAPDYPGVRLQLAKIAVNGDDIDRAMKFIEEEIENHPNSSPAYTELGKIHLLKRNFSEASSKLTIAAKLNPKNVDAVLFLGYTYYLQGKYRNSIALFERAIDLNPLRDDTHWKIGLAYEKDGKYQKAITAYNDFIGLTSDRIRKNKAKRKIASLKSISR